MSTTPPGWYPDPQGQTRWWDGQRWTEHVQPLQQVPQPPYDAQQAHWGPRGAGQAWSTPASSSKKGLWTGLGVGAAALVVGAIVLAVTLGGGGSPEETVEQFIAASNDRDVEAVCDLVTEEYMSDVLDTDPQSCLESLSVGAAEDPTPDSYDFEVGEAEISEDGKSARVPLSMAELGEASPFALVLEKIDGSWKIARMDS